MQAFAITPKRLTLYAAALALAALVVTVVAASFATGSALAQAPTGNEYPTPKPCGPGQDNYPANHDEVVSSGHYALFDAYWQRLSGPEPDGNLHNNLCPPAARHKEVPVGRGQTKEVTTLSASNIDLRHTIIHVTDQHKVEVAANNDAAGTTKISLEKYNALGEALGIPEGGPVPANTQVHWLRLEDPDHNIEPSSLVLGFSTGKLQKQYWAHLDAEGEKLGEAFQYELENVEYSGPHASDQPRVLTYWEPELGSDVVWNSFDTDVNAMPQGPEEYEHLEWVFTHPGTYFLEVHLKGHVRQTKPEGAGDDWQQITPNTTVTSEVKTYVIHVGPLTVNDKPMLGVMRSVNEHAMAGAKVGDPVKVFTTDDDKLNCAIVHLYTDRFGAEATDGGCQVTVKNGALLDYETKQTYHLLLGVSDGKDHENNDEVDKTFDHTIVVQVSLIDRHPGITVVVDNENPQVGESVRITANYNDIHQGYVADSGDWEIKFVENNSLWPMNSDDNGNAVFDVNPGTAGARHYEIVFQYNTQVDGLTENHRHTADLTINWLPNSR